MDQNIKKVYVTDDDGKPLVYTIEIPEFMDIADALLHNFMNEDIGWNQSARVFGNIPSRKWINYSWDPSVFFKFSKAKHHTVTFPEFVHEALRSVCENTGYDWNFAVANIYPDRHSGVCWHTDSGVEFGKNPAIASLSLGAGRVFMVKDNESGEKTNIPLEHGTVLIMGEGVQERYMHQIQPMPKKGSSRLILSDKKYRENPDKYKKNNFVVEHQKYGETRINMTFRIHVGTDKEVEEKVKTDVGYK